MDSYIPVDAAKRAIGADERLLSSVGAVHPAIVQAPVIAHEELVDVLVRPRLQTRYLQIAQKYIAWADATIKGKDGLYGARSTPAARAMWE